MGWFRCCGGSAKPKGIQFPPVSGWTYTKNAQASSANVHMDDDYMGFTNANTPGANVTFVPSITAKDSARTISVTFQLSDGGHTVIRAGGQDYSQTYSVGGVYTRQVTLPANSIDFYIIIQQQWSVTSYTFKIIAVSES